MAAVRQLSAVLLMGAAKESIAESRRAEGMGWFIGFVSIFGTKVGLEWFVYRTIQVASGRTDGLDLCSSGCFFHCLVTWRNRLNFSDEDLI